MKSSCMRLAAVGSLVGATVLSGGIANAADLPAAPVKAPAPVIQPSPWSFQFSPYLWAAGINGDVRLGPAAPLVGVDAGFDDVLKHLHFAFMGTFELRYEKWGFIADISYLSERVSATGPAGFVNGQLEDKTFIGTFAVAYRVFDQQNFWIDAVGGARLWKRSDTLTITAPGPISLTLDRDRTWWDPIIGVRARVYATPSIFLQLYGDVGGFGVGAKSDWQVAGLLGYQYNEWLTFFGGYRYMSVDYDRDGYIFDVDMSGPIFGVTFKF